MAQEDVKDMGLEEIQGELHRYYDRLTDRHGSGRAHFIRQ